MLSVSDSLRSAHNSDGGVVLDIRHGRMYSLNVVGSRILELLKQNLDEAAIAAEISRQFAIGLDMATTDVREFLGSLERHHLIERRDAGLEP